MTLTETQFNIRRWLFFAVLITIVYYVGQFIINSGYNVYLAFFPPKQPVAEAKFGLLPKLKMYPLKIEGSPEYIIEIPQAEMPKFPDRVNIYKFQKLQARFGAEDKVKNLAKDFGFTSQFTKPSTSEYRWTDTNTGRTFTADSLTENFNLDIKFDNLLTISNNNPTILITDATQKIEQFVKSKNLLQPSDIATIRTTAIPTNLSPGKLRESRIYQDRAQLIKINVYRSLQESKIVQGQKDPEIIDYPIIGPNPKDSLINFYASGAKTPLDIPIANIVYWKVNNEEKSEYFVSSIDSVWDTVKQGNGIITYLKLDEMDYYDSPRILNLNRIEIRKIYMAYYENKEYAEYLQPIYVFEGRFTTNTTSTDPLSKNGDIIIYYPAVRGDYVSN